MTYQEACRWLFVAEGVPVPIAEAAYRVAAKETHPDTGGSGVEMQILNEAISVIRDTGMVPRIDDGLPCRRPPRFLRERVGFGKHRDKRWEDVPLGYLVWLAENSEYERSRRMAAQTLHVRASWMTER